MFSGREGIIAYECIFHSSNIDAMNLACNQKIIILRCFDIGITFKDPILDSPSNLWWNVHIFIGGEVFMLDKRYAHLQYFTLSHFPRDLICTNSPKPYTMQ